jgi:hypothetical protein
VGSKLEDVTLRLITEKFNGIKKDMSDVRVYVETKMTVMQDGIRNDISAVNNDI